MLCCVLQAVFNDRLIGEEVREYKSLSKFESRDNQSIQVSASLPDGTVKVLSILSTCVSSHDLFLRATAATAFSMS